jgi:hypothetical protein
MLRPERIFVVPGAGVKVPLPLPGGGNVPAAGKFVDKSLSVLRLLAVGDLVEGKPPEAEVATVQTTAPAEPPAEAALAPAGKVKG